MRPPLQVGVTGGIGSGKSLVCKIFESLGAPVYDSDSRAKILMTTDGILIGQIRKEFGNLSYHPDGALNRQYLSESVFKDTDKKLTLDRLVHPRVSEDYTAWMGRQNFPYVIKEAALLVETGSYRQLNKTIVVTAPAKVRIERVLARDRHRTEEMVMNIMNSQMKESEKTKVADFIINNDGATMVLPQVLSLHGQFFA